jgi:Ca2+-binding EF-hand superfamily protein
MGMGRGMGMMRNRPDYSDFDLDADGEVTEEEYYTARNNRIRERMEQGYRMRNLPNAPGFTDLDTDGNGEISAEEFATHQHMGPWGRTP